MSDHADTDRHFSELHTGERPLLLAGPRDRGNLRREQAVTQACEPGEICWIWG
jgi:hypothetical protein